MRSLLQSSEEAHRPELYLANASEEHDGIPQERKDEHDPTSRDHLQILEEQGEAESKDDATGSSTGTSDEGESIVGGKKRLGQGARRYLRQMERYREYLEEQVGFSVVLSEMELSFAGCYT